MPLLSPSFYRWGAEHKAISLEREEPGLELSPLVPDNGTKEQTIDSVCPRVIQPGRQF